MLSKNDYIQINQKKKKNKKQKNKKKKKKQQKTKNKKKYYHLSRFVAVHLNFKSVPSTSIDS